MNERTGHVLGGFLLGVMLANGIFMLCRTYGPTAKERVEKERAQAWEQLQLAQKNYLEVK